MPHGPALNGALRAALAGLALLASVTAAPAQGFRSGAAPGDFDFYVLALSWSPTFCDRTGSDRGSAQCDPGRRLGFTVHGLWPQDERGAPRACGAERFVPRAAIAEAADIFPDAGLARHQWRQHGTCSGLDPTSYFRATRRAWERIRIPDALREPRAGVTVEPGALEWAFAEANPGLRPDAMAVSCRDGTLGEVRICFTKDLTGFRACPAVDRSGCRFGPLRVPAPR